MTSKTLTDHIIALARQYGRYGYRRVTALLRSAGWHVNRKNLLSLSRGGLNASGGVKG
jgi:HTH-like domain